MTAFVVTSEYTAALDDVDRLRPAHLEWLNEQAQHGGLVIAGRRVPPTGGVLVMIAAQAEDIAAALATDPYVLAGVAKYEVVAFEPGLFPYRFDGTGTSP